MSVEDEKKPRKTPAKKTTTPKKTTATKSVKAAGSGTSKKTTAKSANGGASEPIAPSAGSKASPTHAQIAERAYHHFVARGRQHGFHEQDWLRAELELRSELA